MKLLITSLAYAMLLMFGATAAAAPAQAENAKPNIAILATGGTIASRGADSMALTDYGSNAGMKHLGIQTMIDAVPEVKKFANITGEQVFNVGSSKLAIENWLILAKRTNELLASKDIDGVVITHGTDTIEETAYFLNLVVKSDKPVVLVGAMRPATGLSADGPLNLANAVALAASSEAKNKGVMVCMNDQISSAFGVMKMNTTNAATFQSPNTGYLGYMQNFKPFFVSAPLKKHTYQTEFDVSDLTTLPRVEVNFTTLGSDGVLIDAAVAAGAKGIVNAGVGHANVPAATLKSLQEAQKKGVLIVVGSRVDSGIVTPTTMHSKSGFVSAMMHNAQKARVLLMLALTKTNNVMEIQRIFDEY
ncbi:L-asparaginase 2 [Sporomusa rhizae]|uniref:asparaginase n=1 Tax=Sporomusa rhizae TaxID=357999 RepID=UPI00352BBECB